MSRLIRLSSVLLVSGGLVWGCGSTAPEDQDDDQDSNTGGTSGADDDGTTGGVTGSGGRVSTGGTGGADDEGAGGDDNGTGGGGGDFTGLSQCKADFSAFDACGGDLEGTWELDTVCTDFDGEEAIKSLCADATVSAPVYSGSTGTLEVSGSTWSETYHLVSGYEVTVPTACTQGLNCGQFANALENGLLADLITNAICVSITGGCSCAISYQQEGTTEGVFATVDSSIEIAGSQVTYDYCAGTETLTMRRSDDGADDVNLTRFYGHGD